MRVEPAVEERNEVEPEEATRVEPDEVEDHEEVEEGADEGEGNDEVAVLADGPGDGMDAAAETEKVIKEGSDQDTGMEPAKKGGLEKAVEEDEEPEGWEQRKRGESVRKQRRRLEAALGAEEGLGAEEEGNLLYAAIC